MNKQIIQSLFKTHCARMYRLAVSMLLDGEESRDVVQEVKFLSLFSQMLSP